VRVNLSGVENADQRQRLQDETEAMLSHAKVSIQHVSPRIWSRFEEANRK